LEYGHYHSWKIDLRCEQRAMRRMLSQRRVSVVQVQRRREICSKTCKWRRFTIELTGPEKTGQCFIATNKESDSMNKKTKKIITAIIVILLAFAMIVPTVLWALQGI